MKTQIKVAGYVRVSSKEQVRKKNKSSKGYEEKFSLPIQREAIREYCENNKYILTNIYEDAGVSGRSTKKRYGLIECIRDAKAGKFNELVVYRLSRFGRNARDLLNNYHELKEVGVSLYSITDRTDFGSPTGEAMLIMLSALAQLENDIRRETMLEGRIASAKDNLPATGKGPIGRIFNEKTERWELDENIVPHIRWAANEYISGKLISMWDIKVALEERGIYWSETTLLRTLKERCGTTWTVEFKGEEPIIYTNIDPILDENTIKKINELIIFNRTNNRKDVDKYALSGYLFCGKCGRNLTGSTQVKGVGGKTYSYYRHPSKKKTKCHIPDINLKEMEGSVFRTIFEFTRDWPNFEKAIADSLPDESLRESYVSNIKHYQEQINDIDEQLDNISKAIAKGSKPETHIKTEEELYERREKAQGQKDYYQGKLDELPKAEEVKKQAEEIRIKLIEKYLDDPHRIKKMTYEEKRSLLSWLFGGWDEAGRRYGIYINIEGKGKDKYITERYHGRITEFETDSKTKLYETDDNYKTNNVTTKKQLL